MKQPSLCTAVSFGQRGVVEAEIFGLLEYYSYDTRYTALKKNIFDNLIFSDSSMNEVILEKKYLDKYYKNVLVNRERQEDFFMSKFVYTGLRKIMRRGLP